MQASMTAMKRTFRISIPNPEELMMGAPVTMIMSLHEMGMVAFLDGVMGGVDSDRRIEIQVMSGCMKSPRMALEMFAAMTQPPMLDMSDEMCSMFGVTNDMDMAAGRTMQVGKALIGERTKGIILVYFQRNGDSGSESSRGDQAAPLNPAERCMPASGMAV